MQSVFAGLPGLQDCHIRFHTHRSVGRAQLLLGPDTFRHQRDSLQTLTLRGVGTGICMESASFLGQLRAARRVTVQNLGLVSMKLGAGVTSSPLPPLHSLNLDSNASLQLDNVITAALIKLTTLRELSMRKLSGGCDASSAVASDSDDTDPQSREAIWSLGSIRCLTQLAAARPALRLCL